MSNRIRTIDEEKLTRFYKYRSDLGRNDRNLELISKNLAFFSHPSSFNDPFDCLPAPGISTDDEIKIILRGLTDRDWLNSEQKQKIIECLLGDSQQRISFIREYSETGEFVNEFMSDYIVYCLSKSPLNRLLWSHYGGDHKGFVVEFDLSSYLNVDPRHRTEADEDEFFPIEVNYAEERPVISWAKSNPIEILFTKDKIWKYEKEHRIVLLGKPRAVKFDKKFLSSVILGALTPDSIERKLRDTVERFNEENQSNVTVYRIELDRASYRLNLPGHPLYPI